MLYCKKCGTLLDEDAEFCPECGARVRKTHSSGKPTNNDTSDINQTVRLEKSIYGVTDLSNLPAGHMIDDRYEIKKKLGQGGFGTVYQAYDHKMNVDKALKLIPEAVTNDLMAMQNLRDESQTMIQLNHPNIIRFYDFHDQGVIKYIDMENVDGKTLNALLYEQPNQKMPEDKVKELALQIVEGMIYAHKKGVIHRDIKPQNIMVTNDGQIKIMDFGIAETLRNSMSRLQPTGSSGTLTYMSPEQITGEKIGKESDIYSFGAMVYELLSGHPPFYEGSVLYQILNKPVKEIEGVSFEMNQVLQKCLAKKVDVRFENFEKVKIVINSINTNKNKTNVDQNDDQGQPIKGSTINNNEYDKKESGNETNVNKNRKNYKSLIFTGIAIVILILGGIIYQTILIQQSQKNKHSSNINKYLHHNIKPNLSNKKNKISYSIGYNIGKNLRGQSANVEPGKIAIGINDAMHGKALISNKEMMKILQNFQSAMMQRNQQKRQSQVKINLKSGEIFLASNKSKPGVLTTSDGLQYKILKKGFGPVPKKNDEVVTDYVGTLLNGKVFDSSYKRGKPATFPVDGVIPGWTEALEMMHVGAKWRLFIPPKLAYGKRGAGNTIPPNSVLIFDVVLHSIKKK